MDEQELQALFDKLRSGADLTEAELKKLNTALNGSSKNLDQFKSALVDSSKDVAKSLGRFALDLGDGSKGFTQLNPLIDATSNALGGMAKAIPFAGEAINAAVKATAEGTKFIIEQLQKTTQTFQDLSDVGAVTAKGMSGIQEQFLRSGMSLNGFQKSIKENSASLARFRGLTADGAEEFSKIVGGIVDSKAGDELRRIGFSADQIGEAAGAYVAQQTRLGLAQNKSQKQLQAGAAEYAKELDQLTKLTGMSRKEIQAQQDAALSEGRFRAQYDEMVASGQEKAAKELLDFQTQISKVAPELGQAIRDQASGITSSEAAIKGFNSTAGALPDIIERLKSGEITRDQAIQELQNATKDNIQTQRDYAKAVGDGTGTFLKYSELSDLNNATMQDGVLKAKKAQDAQIAGQDELTNKTVEAQKNMEQMSRQIQNLGFQLMPQAATAISKFTDSLNEFLKFVSKTTGVQIPSIAGGAGGFKEKTAADISKQDEENWKKATLGEKASLATAKTIENVGMGIGKALEWMGADKAGKALQGVAEKAKEERVASDTSYLEKTGRGDAKTKAYLQPSGGAAPAAPSAGGGRGNINPPMATEPQGPGAQGKPGGALPTAPLGGKATSEKPIESVVGAGPGFTTVQTTDGEKQRREGVRNWRNNNPGNMEFGNFARSFGAVGTDGRFAVFPTLDAGSKAKEELLFGAKSKYINLSIADAINRYAPPNENNTAAYIDSVTKAIGVPSDTVMNRLDAGQRQQMLDAISRVEGFKTGKIVTAADGGVFTGPTKGYPATLHGTEAVIPMPDGKTVPVKFEAPNRQQVIETYADMFKALIPGLVSAEQNKTIEEKSSGILQKLTSAINDIFTTTPRKQTSDVNKFEIPGLDEFNKSLGIDKPKFEILGLDEFNKLIKTKQTKFEVPEVPEVPGLDEFNKLIKSTQTKFEIPGLDEFNKSAKSNQPKVEVPSPNDFIKQQKMQTGWGIGNWQSGDISGLRTPDANTKAIEDIIKGMQENPANTSEDKVAGMLDKFANTIKEMFAQQNPQNGMSQELIGAVREMVQAQRDNVNISSKILQVSQN